MHTRAFTWTMIIIYGRNGVDDSGPVDQAVDGGHGLGLGGEEDLPVAEAGVGGRSSEQAGTQ